MIDVLFKKCEQCEILHASHSFSIPTEMPGPYQVLDGWSLSDGTGLEDKGSPDHFLFLLGSLLVNLLWPVFINGNKI